MVHVVPTRIDLPDIEHTEFSGQFVTHLREAGCALCAAGFCTQRIIDDPLAEEPVVVHGRLLN